MDRSSDSKPNTTEPQRARRPYRAPRLVRLGTLTELTMLVGADGHSDTHGTKTS
jgi:hypothetical protein